MDEALQMYSDGFEKSQVICKILSSLFGDVSDINDNFVIFLEPNRNHKQDYFVHMVSIPQNFNFIKSEKLLCEKNISITPPVPLNSIPSVPLVQSKGRITSNNTATQSSRDVYSKQPHQQWSFRKSAPLLATVKEKDKVKENNKKSKKNFWGKKTSDGTCLTDPSNPLDPTGPSFESSPLGGAKVKHVLEAKFKIFETNLPEIIEQLKALKTFPLRKGRGALIFHHVDKNDEALLNAKIKVAINTLYIIQSLFKKKLKERRQELQERIFNEIVQTMALPLIVFDVRNNLREKNSDFSDPKKMICSFYNDAFYKLTTKASQNQTGQNEKGQNQNGQNQNGQNQTGQNEEGKSFFEFNNSPKDQQYKDDKHHPFAEFLAHPTIYNCLLEIMQSRVKDQSHHHVKDTKDADAEDSRSKSFSSLTSFRTSDDVEIEKVVNACKASQTISLEYGDQIIPHSHYEMDLYKVNGTRVGVVIRDVSEKMEHLRLIEQASKAKTEFLANINHEFRTPLNSIDGNLQLLAKTVPLTDRQNDLIHRMRLSEAALMSLLQEILDYAKLEQHRMQLHLDTFSLRHCIQASLDVTEHLATNKKNSTSYEMKIDVPTLIVGDSFRLQQILVNLLTNAIEFTTEGKISIQVSRQGEYLRFDVTDTGTGIEPTIKDSLFQAWVHTSSSPTGRTGPTGSKDTSVLSCPSGPSGPMCKTHHRVHHGTGLGLAICKKLCKLMGGKIWLESTTKNVGSTFSFYIKLILAEDGEVSALIQEEMAILKNKQILILYPTVSTMSTVPTASKTESEHRKELIKSFLRWKIRPTFCATVDEVREYLSSEIEFHAIIMGELCGNCGNHLIDKEEKAGKEERKVKEVKEDNHQDVIELARWITSKYPNIPLIGVGDVTSVYDEDCSKLFRKVLQSPIQATQIFYVLVNLFSKVAVTPQITKEVVEESNRKGENRKGETNRKEENRKGETNGRRKITLPSLSASISGSLASYNSNNNNEDRTNSNVDFSKLRCLVVEDIVENRNVLVEMLEFFGCKNVQSVTNGKEMLDTLSLTTQSTSLGPDQGSGFDVVFLDLLMPVMDGFQAIKEYRKLHELGTKPFIVAVTATNLISHETYEEEGMDAFIQKPIKMNELKTLLDVCALLP